MSPSRSSAAARHRRHGAGPAVYLALAAGGAAGALARYALGEVLPAGAGRFPTGTFVVNLSGCVALGLLLVLLDEVLSTSRLARPLLATGFVGAYTTFSTFAVEAVLLAHSGRWALGAVYVSASLAAGLAAAVAGVAGGRTVLALAGRRRTGR